MSTLIFVFDVEAFRISYPAFADPTTFPDDMLQGFWDTAICYISDVDYGWLAGAARFRALNLMTAHLTALSVLVAAGQTPGLVTQAMIDKVSLSLMEPPVKNQWQWWLSLTPYGQQLFALLQVSSVGGMYIGGSPQRLAFRGIGGCWR